MKLAESLPPKLTQMEEIILAKKQLKKKKSKDSYGWNNEMIIEGGEEMDKSLLNLFNTIEKD